MAWLLEGRSLLVTDRFGTGLGILALAAPREKLEDPGEDAGCVAKRAFREAFQVASKRRLAPSSAARVALPDAPRAGFLAELYPYHADFALPVEDAKVLSNACATTTPPPLRRERGAPISARARAAPRRREPWRRGTAR